MRLESQSTSVIPLAVILLAVVRCTSAAARGKVVEFRITAASSLNPRPLPLPVEGAKPKKGEKGDGLHSGRVPARPEWTLTVVVAVVQPTPVLFVVCFSFGDRRQGKRGGGHIVVVGSPPIRPK